MAVQGRIDILVIPQGQPQYTRSPTYRLLENAAERIQVLQGLKQIGAYRFEELGDHSYCES